MISQGHLCTTRSIIFKFESINWALLYEGWETCEQHEVAALGLGEVEDEITT
jgi:hypothetical protein